MNKAELEQILKKDVIFARTTPSHKLRIVQTLKDMGIAYLIAILLVIILLVGLFKNYSQILIILFSVPFGIMGVYLGLFVSNMAMSYTSLIGMIAKFNF